MDGAAYHAYRSVIESPTLRSIWATTYGERFWPDVEPPWTLSTIEDVEFVTRCLGSQPRNLIDLGCGSGCLARYLVRTSGARVVGIDANPIAVRAAEDRSTGPPYLGKVEFRATDIADTRFADETFDGTASLDVLLFASDKRRALREIFRVLEPGSVFAGTTFELRTPSLALGADAFEDYPGAFDSAGFMLELYSETDGWRRLIEEVTAAIRSQASQLGSEISSQPLARIVAWAEQRPRELDDSRRVRFCARKAS